MISEPDQVIEPELSHRFAAAHGARCRYRPSVAASGRNWLGQLIPLASSPASAANRVRATESLSPETINDFCNKIDPKQIFARAKASGSG
jgi:hypothetical protein